MRCLTVTVLASISVNMNSPPSKSPFRYNSALKIKKSKQSFSTDSTFIITIITISNRFDNGSLIPVVSVCICWWFFPALIGLGVQQTVVSMDGMA